MIGVGGRGQELLKQVLGTPNAQLVAIATFTREAGMKPNGWRPAFRRLDDHGRLLDMKDIDAVSWRVLCTSMHGHFWILSRLARPLLRKTMTWSVSGSGAVLAAAKNSNRVVQIGLQHESSGSLADARKWIKDGIVGKLPKWSLG